MGSKHGGGGGPKKKVVVTLATGNLIDKVAKRRGKDVRLFCLRGFS